MREQPGANKVARSKKTTRIVTAAIISKAIAFDILDRHSPAVERICLNEQDCLQHGAAADNVDFVAACVFIRGCCQV